MIVSVHFTLIILTGALCGWLITRFFIWVLFNPTTPKKIAGFTYTGIFPALKPAMAGQLASMAKEINIAEKINIPAITEQLMSEIENHADDFLTIKLKEAFPLLSNLMGEKTLAKFKEAFMEEAHQKMPALIENFIAKMNDNGDIINLVKEKINDIEIKTLRAGIKNAARKQLKLFQIAGIVLGIMAALIQLFLSNLFHM